jgi:hypothetical protein
MDRGHFDAWTRLLASPGSRRTALAALLSAALLGHAEPLLAHRAKKKGKRKNRRRKKRGPAEVQVCRNGETLLVPRDAVPGILLAGGTQGACAPAVGAIAPAPVAPGGPGSCANPGPSSNLSGCNFDNRDLAGIDLHGSRMVQTSFRGADLCGADLHGSTLTGADFRGSTGLGRATNLFRADLGSSSCNGIQFDERTLFCRTRTCSGAIRDDNCPAGVDPQDVCCVNEDCPDPKVCVDHQCVPCGPANCPNGCCTPEGECRVNDAFACGAGGVSCGVECPGNQACLNGECVSCAVVCPNAGCFECGRLADGTTVCGNGQFTVACNPVCTSSAACPGGTPQCAFSVTVKQTNLTQDLGPLCGHDVGTSVCVAFRGC